MQNFSLENVNQQGGRIAPFRITAVRIPLAELDKILDHLQIVSFHLNGDWALDWEDRNEACRSCYDAICALRDLLPPHSEVQI